MINKTLRPAQVTLLAAALATAGLAVGCNSDSGTSSSTPATSSSSTAPSKGASSTDKPTAETKAGDTKMADTKTGDAKTSEPGQAAGKTDDKQKVGKEAGDVPGDKPTGPKVKTETGLESQVIRPGKGATPQQGQQVFVHYTGWLTDGKKFDSSVDRGTPFDFTLGAHQVIPGWDEGVALMKVGEKRKFIIPSKLGYGEAGTPGGPIPGGATLIFDVELLSIK